MKFKFYSVALLALLVPTFALAQGSTANTFAACAGSADPADLDRQIDELIAKMTMDERIAQMQDRAPAIPRLGIAAYNWWNEGLHGIARNGRATVFPQAIGLAATFDAALIGKVGETVGTEARARFNPHQNADSERYAGLTIWSPNINIFRDPRWGRGQETYGEDPFLTGQIGAAFVRGIQGPDGFYLRASATAKHFAAHSGPESIRDGFNSKVTAHDLADTYLPAFHTLVTEGHVSSIMCSYNAISGTPACGNENLLVKTVRGQWGFTGYMVSDCDAIDEITAYLHYTPDHAHGTADALKAGIDLDCGNTYKHLREAVDQKLVSEENVNLSLHRLLLVRLRLGMLQPASCSPYGGVTEAAVNTPESKALALRVAEESMVLLKNDGRVLPYNFSNKRIAVVGPTAESIEQIEANYHGTVSKPESLLEGMIAALPATAKVSYAQGATLAEGLAVPVPHTALSHDGKAGVVGEYFANNQFEGRPVLTRTDSRIDLDLDRVEPAPGVGQNYSVRWTGEITPPAAGDYRLQISLDRCFDCKGHDGYQLWIDGKKMLDDDGSASKRENSVQLQFASAQPHGFRLQLAHTGEDEGVHLQWIAPAEAQLAEARKVAAEADVIVAMVGLSPSLEGEALGIKIPGFNGGDREILGLPKPQRDLLAALNALHKPVVVVLTSGSAVAPGEEMLRASALLEAWYPGEAGGRAIGNLLSGKANPSGRLPLTVYRKAEDLPAFTDYSMANRTYRYFAGPVAFGFGSGLSYSTFTYATPTLSAKQMGAGQTLHVEAMVKNSSKMAGSEVVELYLIPPAVAGAPRLALRGVERVQLAAGEAKKIGFDLTADAVMLVNESGERQLVPGNYAVSVGGSQPEAEHRNAASFEVVAR